MHNLIIIIITNRAEAEKIVSAMSPEKVKLQQQLVKKYFHFFLDNLTFDILVFEIFMQNKIKEAHELVGMSEFLV